LYPLGKSGGFLHSEVTVKIGAVMVIFFISGLTLKFQDMQAAVFQIKFHVFVQVFSMVIVPITMFIVVNMIQMFYVSLHPDIKTSSTLNVGNNGGEVSSFYAKFYLLNGFLVTSCMPPPVSSAVILTKAVGGNEVNNLFFAIF